MNMMLDICAGVDPEANRDAVNKVEERFDAEMSGYGDTILDNAIGAFKRREPALSFPVDQLKAILASAEEKESSRGRL